MYFFHREGDDQLETEVPFAHLISLLRSHLREKSEIIDPRHSCIGDNHFTKHCLTRILSSFVSKMVSAVCLGQMILSQQQRP